MYNHQHVLSTSTAADDTITTSPPSSSNLQVNCSTASSVIVEPSPMDVLCGRDRNYTKHPGNQVYRNLLEQQAFKYETKLSKAAKMEITKSIVQTMQTEHGSRFVRRIGNHHQGWEVLSHIQARDKTSHALRFHNNTTKKSRKTTIAPAGTDIPCHSPLPAANIHNVNAVVRLPAEHHPTTTANNRNATVFELPIDFRPTRFDNARSSHNEVAEPLPHELWTDYDHDIGDLFGNFNDSNDVVDTPNSHFSSVNTRDDNLITDQISESSPSQEHQKRVG
jgi:hypothetical protein